MRTKPADGVAFGYKSPLKTLYIKGKLHINKGFYGGTLTKENVTLEHLVPYSKGGKTTLDNLVLATKENNIKSVAGKRIPKTIYRGLNGRFQRR